MAGKTVKDHTYYACTYARQYGAEAAKEAGHFKTELIREDVLHDATLRFFAHEIFGGGRLQILREQQEALRREVNPQAGKARKRLQTSIAETERRIRAQVIAIEDGLELRLAQNRIAELEQELLELNGALADIETERKEILDIDSACTVLDSIPDLLGALRDAPPELLSQVFDAFRLTLEVNRVTEELTVRVFISSALGGAKTIEDVARLAPGKTDGRPMRPPVSDSFI